MLIMLSDSRSAERSTRTESSIITSRGVDNSLLFLKVRPFPQKSLRSPTSGTSRLWDENKSGNLESPIIVIERDPFEHFYFDSDFE